mgnify:CR=1 FL=1
MLGVVEHLGDRALLAGELALARWLMHGVRARDGQIIDDAIAMLGQLEVDLAGATPIGYVEPVVEPVGSAAPVASAVDEGYPEDEPPDEVYPEDDPAASAAQPAAAVTSAGDDSDTAELRTDELRVPDYQRRAVPRGHDDTPTVQLPPQSPEED